MLTGKSEHQIRTYSSREVTVGDLQIGGLNPVRVQTMTNTDTCDVQASTSQCLELADHGSDLIRLTVQGKKEKRALDEIISSLRKSGCNVPVVADIHFRPGLAEETAPVADKIRINPGNYLAAGLEFNDGIEQAKIKLRKLTDICRKNGTAIRIGVNHGSLNERILNRYGDTPLGMAESALEFIRICNDLGFHDIIISLKSSNPVVMVQSNRLLVKKMMDENLKYPLHLGVTEAGDGLGGRMKSVVGIAPLLLEGMGDTIRISLTEDPVNELPIAKSIAMKFKKPDSLPYSPFTNLAWDPFSFSRRRSKPVLSFGNGRPPVIISSFKGREGPDLTPVEVAPFAEPGQAGYSLFVLDHTAGNIQDIKHQASEFCKSNNHTPIIYKKVYTNSDHYDFQLALSGDLGFLLMEGIIDGVWIENRNFTEDKIYKLLLTILQAAGSRISKTEYISCPSCGRTHFDIISRLAEIKEATSHLKHLKIGIMGCIVNGPGEMADADYGYVGSGKEKVSIYRGKEVVFKNVPEQSALNMLISLIKEQGDWVEN